MLSVRDLSAHGRPSLPSDSHHSLKDRDSVHEVLISETNWHLESNHTWTPCFLSRHRRGLNKHTYGLLSIDTFFRFRSHYGWVLVQGTNRINLKQTLISLVLIQRVVP